MPRKINKMFEALKLQLEPYLFAIKIAAIVLVFLSGCYVTHLYYSNKLADAIIATQKAEAALAAKGSDIQVKFIKDTQTIEVKGKDRQIRVTEYVPKIEYVTGTCPNPNLVSNGFVEYHNAAVENRELKLMSSTELSQSSEITQQRVATVINSNYTLCNKYITQIEALQEFLIEVEKKTK